MIHSSVFGVRYKQGHPGILKDRMNLRPPRVEDLSENTRQTLMTDMGARAYAITTSKGEERTYRQPRGAVVIARSPRKFPALGESSQGSLFLSPFFPFVFARA